MNIKNILFAGILVIIFSVGGTILLFTSSQSSVPSTENVSIVDGVQIIDITAKSGYAPKVTQAKAGIATKIKVDTSGTYDCSAALRIPNLDYETTLPANGSTLIDVPAQTSGSTLGGVCTMGMYSFSVIFN